MTQTRLTKILALCSLALLAAPIVWASFWYNRGAGDVLNSALLYMGLYLLPMLALVARACLPKVNPLPYVLLFCLMMPLLALTYTERDGTGWLYALCELPVLWAFGVHACLAMAKYASAESRA